MALSNAYRRPSLAPLYAIVLICLAPLLFALAAYYVPALGLRPPAQANYGQLIDPQRPVPTPAQLHLRTLQGESFNLGQLRGRWVLLSADSGHCPESCVRKLFILRNSHASQGKNVERVTRVWLLTDQAAPAEHIIKAYQGTHIVRANPDELRAFLPTPDTNRSQPLHAGMWVIDPLGNLMMVFPDNADPLKVRKDLSKLLYNSRIG